MLRPARGGSDAPSSIVELLGKPHQSINVGVREQSRNEYRRSGTQRDLVFEGLQGVNFILAL
jgi:hypothetical protein